MTSIERMTLMFSALGQSERLKIMELLKDGPRFAKEILQDISIEQSTLSHHMKILTDSNLIAKKRQGKFIFYSLNQDAQGELTEMLKDLFEESVDSDSDQE